MTSDFRGETVYSSDAWRSHAAKRDAAFPRRRAIMIRSRRPHYHRHLVAAVGIRPDADLKYALCVCLCLDSRYGRNVKKTKQNMKII